MAAGRVRPLADIHAELDTPEEGRRPICPISLKVSRAEYLPATDPPQLPLDEKFSIWLDEDGDYMMQSQREHELQVSHASTQSLWLGGCVEVLAFRVR